MAKYRFSKKAVDDLTQIWNYTLYKWSEKQADIYYKMLIDNCKEIASHPDLGKNHDEIMEGLLAFKVGRHIIYYREIDENEIEIIRILHGIMDLNKRIKEE